MCENCHEIHPAGANARNARATEASGTETNASGNMARCVIKPGITVYCIYNDSGIILTGSSRNNTDCINKLPIVMCAVGHYLRHSSWDPIRVPDASTQVIKRSNVAPIDWNLPSGMNIE
jgi:hypothetical protein